MSETVKTQTTPFVLYCNKCGDVITLYPPLNGKPILRRSANAARAASLSARRSIE